VDKDVGLLIGVEFGNKPDCVLTDGWIWGRNKENATSGKCGVDIGARSARYLEQREEILRYRSFTIPRHESRTPTV
jgi:hypothetical protein